MSININSLIDNYYNWLKDKTAIKQVKDWIEITTPYLDRHNDYIQIYLKQDGNDYLLTDDSYTIQDLQQSGCSLDSIKRQKILEVTLNGFGVHKDKDEIYIKTNYNDFPINKHNLIQSMLAVNDMFYLAKSNIINLFFEDVQKWLEVNDIRFIERVPFIGKSGYSRHYDFVIPKSRNAPERVIKTVNNPNKGKVDELAFSWLDTKDVRTEEAKSYAFVNDNEKPIPESFTNALASYNISTIPWSNREQFSRELAA
jgi:hypothetical protein